MALSGDMIRRLMEQDTNSVFATLIDIIFPDTTVWHMCDNRTDITYNAVVYRAANFTFDPPDIKAGESGAAKISLCVVDQQLPAAILSITEAPILIAHTLVMKDDFSQVEHLEQWPFELRDVTWTDITLSASLVFDTHLDTEIPSRGFDFVLNPGCH